MKTETPFHRAFFTNALALLVAFNFVSSSKAASFVNTGYMNASRVWHTATLLPNGKVLVAGGYDSNAYASAELYDPISGTWTLTGAMKTNRYSHTATLLPNGKVLVAGGQASSFAYTGPLSTAELYDPATETWTTTGMLTTNRSSHTATLLSNGKVLIAGGGNNNGELSSAELFDPATETWTTTGSMNTNRYYHTATLLPNGKVLVVGGSVGIPLSGAELYDPNTGTWTATASLSTARYGHTETLLPNGKVLIAAGEGNSGRLSSAVLYNPTTGTWATTGTLYNKRRHHTATLLPNGKVLVAGSYTGGTAGFADAELYDSSTQTWSAAGDLIVDRYQHTGTLLSNGKVLVAGGYAAYVRSSTELYEQAPIKLNSTVMTNGTLQFSFTNNVGELFDVLATTNLSLPLSNWTALGGVTELSPGQFRFTDPQATNFTRRFYRVRAQ